MNADFSSQAVPVLFMVHGQLYAAASYLDPNSDTDPRALYHAPTSFNSAHDSFKRLLDRRAKASDYAWDRLSKREAARVRQEFWLDLLAQEQPEPDEFLAACAVLRKPLILGA